jgi:PAS domain S-box-containing protein
MTLPQVTLVTSQLPSATLLSRFFELSADLFCVVNPLGEVTQVNPAFRRTLGWGRNEMIGRPLLDFVQRDDVAAVREVLANLVKNQSKGSLECRMLSKDGQPRRMMWNAQAEGNGTLYLVVREAVVEPAPPPRGGDNGLPTTRELKASDSAIRQRTELALHASEERLRALSEATQEGLVFHEQGTIIDLNLVALNMVGAAHDEVVGHHILEFVPKALHPLALAKMQQPGKVDPFEIAIQQRSGAVLPVEAAVREFDYQSRAVRVIALRDISQRKTADRQLRLQAAALESAANGIVITDRAGVIQWVNPAFTATTGYTLSEAVGQNPRLLKSGEHGPEFYKAMWDTILAGNPWKGEIINRRKDGSLYTEDQTITPVKDVRGEVTGFVVTKQDISARKQAEALLTKRAEDLAIINRIVSSAAASTDIGSAIQQLGEEVTRLFRADGGYVALYAPHTNLVELPYFLDNGQLISVPPAPLGPGPTSHIIQTGLPLLINDNLRERMQALGARHTGADEEGDITQSWLGVPINVGQRVIGVLNVGSNQAGRFTEADVNLLSTIAANVGTVVENARLFEQTRRRAEEVAAINRIVTMAASSTDLRTILRTAARELLQLLDLRNCGIGVLEDTGRHITILADANADPNEPSGEGVNIPVAGNPSTEYVLTHKRALVIENAQTDPMTAPIHDLMRARRTTGLMIVPLVRRGGVIGTLGCDLTDSARKFTPDEVTLVESIAGQLAGAIDNLQLFQEAQEQASELETVAQVGAVATSTLNPQELLQTTVNLTKQNFRLYHAHIYLANDVRDALVLAAGAGEVGQTMVAQGWRIPVDSAQSLVARAARTRRPVVINDVQTDPGWLPNALLPNTRSEVALPLVAGSDLLGVLDVQADQVNRFDDSDVRIMSTLAAQIATALQNARLFSQTQKALSELSTLTQRLTREGWRGYMTEQQLEHQAYVYDLAQVRSVPPGSFGQTHLLNSTNGVEQHGLSQPLKVQGQTIGKLAVAEVAAPNAEAEEIMAAVADRLSSHLENLRLADETRINLVKQERLSAQLATVAQVSTVASTILERQQLLDEVANLTKERFNLYHSNIYLFDNVGDTLNLYAASGEVGRQMVNDGRSIPLLLENSIVARAARERKAIIINNVQESESFLPHPLLPFTRSEMAVPMLISDRLLGVFDVQASQVDRFTEEDIRIQSTLAAQVAVALQNASLYAEQTATVARLKELDQLKSSFLANMSHELRTPLNSILGFTDVIIEGLDGPLTEQMESDLKVVQKNGQHLLKLINDILDMAKIEAGRMTISPEPVDLVEVMDEVVQTTAPLAREKRLLLNADADSVNGLIVEADRMRLRQVLLNLVGNAIKFTERGTVTVSAENMGESVLLCVKDTGIGIAPEKLELVFEAFSQVDTSTTRKVGGTGLGLPISRHLIELHGGRLWAESSGHNGEGSRFFVELPIRVNRTLSTPAGFVSEGYSG